MAKLMNLLSTCVSFRKPLGYRNGTHVDNKFINFAICVEVHLINRLKLLAFDLALKAKKVPVVPRVSRQSASYSRSGFGHLTQDKRCCVRWMIDAWSSRRLHPNLRSKNLLKRIFVRILNSPFVIFDDLHFSCSFISIRTL